MFVADVAHGTTEVVEEGAGGREGGRGRRRGGHCERGMGGGGRRRGGSIERERERWMKKERKK